MKKIDQIEIELKNLFKEGPVPAAEGEKHFKDKLGVAITHWSFREAKKKLGITSYKSPSGIWWWSDPSVKMTSEMKDVWIEKYKDLFKEDNIEDYVENEEKEVKGQDIYHTKDSQILVQDFHYENPYEWLEENAIFYFDTKDDLTQLTNSDETWAIELRRKPQRLETFKDIAALDPDNLPEMHDVDGEDNVALKWMITSNNWIEEAKELQKGTKDTKYKTLTREEEQESIEHRKAYKEYYGHSFY